LYLVADYGLYDESHTFSQPSSGSWLNGIEQDKIGTIPKHVPSECFFNLETDLVSEWIPILFRSKVSTIKNFLR
jgi:hypothetical protein